jgi:uridine phosphorylase
MTISDNDALINPKDGTPVSGLGPTAVMVSTRADLQILCRRFRTSQGKSSGLFNSRIYRPDTPWGGFSLVGPMIGAPYAVMVLEKMIAGGVKNVLFLGWCGAVSSDVRIGDIIIPSGAIIDEGTSRHYHPEPSGRVLPSGVYTEEIRHAFSERNIRFKQGDIWTTDAIYRETPRKVLSFQKKGALAVEMEMSALFTVARYRKIQIGGILVVSDEVAGSEWRPGFKTDHFLTSRKHACEVIEVICSRP